MTPKELATQFIDDLAQSDMSRDEAIASLTNRIILLAMDYQQAAISAERAMPLNMPRTAGPDRSERQRVGGGYHSVEWRTR